MGNTLLLISAIPEDQAFAAEAAISAGLSLTTVPDPKEAAAKIAQESFGAIFVDATTPAQSQAFENAIQETVGLFSDQVNSNHIHFISASPLHEIGPVLQSPLFGHYIFRNYGDVKISGTHYGRIIRGTLMERAFGLENWMKPGTKVQNVQLKVSTQKHDAVEAVRKFLVQAKFQARMASLISNSVDELLMNAIFDAPVDEMGKPMFANLARTTAIRLENKNVIELRIAFDGEYVAISAVDRFGSMDKAKLLKHISKTYTEEEYKVRTAVAGAGIGLATVFNTGGSFLFVSEAQVKTEVTVFFRRFETFREFREQFKFLSTQFYF